MKIRHFYRIPPEDWLFTTNADVAAAQRKAIENPQMDERDIEEYVRQWVLRELIETYGYPREWLGERIVVEESVPVATADKEADIALKNERGRPYIFIETKKAGLSDPTFERAERQLETYLSATHTATIGMLTDAHRVKVIRKKIDPNDFEYIPDIPHYEQKLSTRGRLVRELPPNADAKRIKTGLKPISHQYENLLFEAHSAIRDIDGMHDDEALDELSKILYTKIYDERTTSTQGIGATFRFQIYGASSASEAASNIRELYDEARKRDIEIFAQRIPGYERSRGVFSANIRLSDVALARVVEILQDYSLIDSNLDVKGRAFQRVLGSAIRSGMGQYFTPDPVVRLAIEMLNPTPQDIILDPFCGSGHFLTRALDFVLERYGDKTDEYTLHEFRFFKLHGIEKSDRMVRIAMTDMLLHDDGHSNIRNTNALLSFDNYPDIMALGGDENKDPEIFTIVVTNPPFGSLMQEEARRMLGRFELGRNRKTVPLEILGLERCLQFLKPGGRMAIVLPDSILANKQTAYVREWLVHQVKIRAIVSLPIETFMPYGATHKTSLCIFRKWKTGESKNFDVPVFLGRIDSIGYDATGRERSNSEVNEIARQFADFINRNGW